MSEARIDLKDVRRRMGGERGRRYWKSLSELTAEPDFKAFLEREFPEQAATWDDPNGRRDFIQLMGASMALAGLTGCTRQPAETIVPFVNMPEQAVPGRPVFYATAALDRGFAKGILVESHMGRPTKIEGNTEHPMSLGATDVFAQASILDLYDPDRSQTLSHRHEIRTWGAFVGAMQTVLQAQRAIQGEGLRILTETVTSPSLAAQLEALLVEFPAARWHQYEPLAADNARAGALLAFGEPLAVHHQIPEADVILSLEADFVGEGPANLRDIRAFSARRRVDEGDDNEKMNRLYVVESTPSLTGGLADHRLPVAAARVETLARSVATGLGLAVSGGDGSHASWVQAVVDDLKANGSRALVMAGESQPPAVHALAHAMNEALGSVGTTVTYTAPIEARSEDQHQSLAELARDMSSGSVDLLVVLGANPVYTAPADMEFGAAMDLVPLRVHLGLYHDETTERCHWHVPQAHPLETWSDARAADGSVTILQPLIAPLYEGRSAHELLAVFDPQRPDRKGHDVVREYWRGRLGDGDFESVWRRALHDGVLPGTAAPVVERGVSLGEWAQASTEAPGDGLEMVFRADPCVGDGRHANNGWLQELPKPLTKLTWDNVAYVSPKFGERLGISPPRFTARGTVTDVVRLEFDGRSVEAPVWMLPGQAENTVTLPLGYGRHHTGRVGSGAGFDAYRLRGSSARWFGSGIEIHKTGGTVKLASTQDHWTIEHQQQAEQRHVVRSEPLSAFLEDPHIFQAMGHDPPADMSLFPAHEYQGHAWGMTIDLNSCVGCNACVVACQSENNIPVVGREQVSRGREMHWIRVDRYYQGDVDEPDTHFQPVPCMHCENAPCEQVCPVAATVHSDEGLNDMVYNRCVGTRYCSNNCPYKVRRFNFFLYNDWDTPSLKLQRNPDVTVRSRGVMEKCTYCVQRINQARIDASNNRREIEDGDIKTACEAACPAQAIVFGDVNDPESRVSKLKATERNYALLADLNTRPRTTYLAQLRNPNPALATASEGHG